MQIMLKYLFSIFKIFSIMSSHIDDAKSKYDNKNLYKFLLNSSKNANYVKIFILNFHNFFDYFKSYL